MLLKAPSKIYKRQLLVLLKISVNLKIFVSAIKVECFKQKRSRSSETKPSVLRARLGKSSGKFAFGRMISKFCNMELFTSEILHVHVHVTQNNSAFLNSTFAWVKIKEVSNKVYITLHTLCIPESKPWYKTQ